MPRLGSKTTISQHGTYFIVGVIYQNLPQPWLHAVKQDIKNGQGSNNIACLTSHAFISYGQSPADLIICYASNH